MLNMLFKPTPTMRNDGRSAHILFTTVAVLAAVAMFLCATGSGNQTTAEPLPDFVNTAANVLAGFICCFFFVPKTHAHSRTPRALIMIARLRFTDFFHGVAPFF